MTGEEQFKELYRRYIHREGAEELLEWMERETDFFTAPASTKHHLAYPGGLVEHSVNVFRELRKVVIDNEPTMEAVTICALLHDLCKANTYVREHHAGPGEVYSYVKKDRFPMGHGEKSVYLIARFMKLEDEEALAIRWHMGFSGEENVKLIGNALRMYPLALALSIADCEASSFVEERRN